MSEVITYIVLNPKLEAATKKAVTQWNEVLVDLVELKPTVINPDIIIKFGKIDLNRYPDRIAQCVDRKGKWEIILGDHVKWASNAFERLFGFGNNIFACIAHELGHVFDLPHAEDPNYVMHAQLNNNGIMTKAEKKQYRNFFVNANN